MINLINPYLFSISNVVPFSPADLSPTIWYDLEDLDYSQIHFNSAILNNYTSVNKLVNKANAGTYDADQGASANKLMFNCHELNNHIALQNLGNGYAQTYYAPKMGADGCISFACTLKVPTSLTSSRAAFGVNDNSGHRFYVQLETTGQISVGIGNVNLSSTATFTAGQVLYVVGVTRNVSGTKYIDVWVNGTKVIDNQTFTFSGTSGQTMLIHGRTTGATPGNFFNTGYVGDIIVVERSITDAERTSLETYLAEKTTDNVQIKVIIVAGQSNAQGINDGADYTDVTKEKPDYRIWQVAGVNVSNENAIIPAWEPLKNRSQDTNAVGLGFAAAKAYLATNDNPNVRVLIVPCAKGDTGFISGEWVRTTGSLYTNLVAKANLALGVGSNVELLWMLWQQGERDVGSLTQVQYQDYYLDMVTGYRSEITGGSGLKVTAGEMVPDFSGGAIRTAVANLPNVDPITAFVSSAGLTDEGDNLHFDAASSRVMAQRHFDAYDNMNVADKLLYASTQNRIMSFSETRTKTGCFVRTPHYVCDDRNSLQVAFANFIFNVGTGTVQGVGNTYTIESMVLESDALSTSVPVTFGGSSSVVVTDGQALTLADEILPAAFGLSKFAHGSVYWIKAILSVPTTAGKLPCSARFSTDVLNEQIKWYDPAATTVSNINTFGAFTTTGTAPDSRAQGIHFYLLGKAAPTTKVYIGIGDSITEWVQDLTANSYHGRGWFQRAMGSASKASCNVSVSGFTTLNFTNAANDKWKDFLQYATHAVTALGTNDYGTAASSAITAGLKTRTQSIWASCVAAGIPANKILANELNCWTTSTDNWATTANQTKAAGWSAGLEPDLFNQWLAARDAVGEIGKVIPSQSIRDGTDPWKWKVNGTANYYAYNAQHPATQGHILKAAELTALI